MSNCLSKMSSESKVSENVPTNKNSDGWTTLHSIILSKSESASKVLALKSPKDNSSFILTDIRVFCDNGRATRYGVCLTQFEFDYLARVLVYAKQFEQELNNKTGTRRLLIKPKPNINGVAITQTVNDRVRR